MAEPVALLPGEGVSLAEIETMLVTGLGCRRGERSPIVRTYHDTFDGRLFRAGLVAEHEELAGRRWLRVRRLGETTALAQAAVDRVEGPVDRLADGRLRRILRDPCGGRALLPLVRTTGELAHFGPVDALDKTTVRVTVVTGSAAVVGRRAARQHQLEPVITISPVRGHERAHAELVDAVALRLGQRPAADPLRRAAGAAGVALGLNPSDRAVTLDAAAPAPQSLALLLRRLAGVLEADAPGVRARLDDEFLHDFRVTLRTARAVVGVAGSLLEPAAHRELSSGLAEMMALTSPARDLDVLRAAWLDDEVLATLVPALDEERAAAHRALVEALDGARFRALLGALRADHPAPAGSPVPSTGAWASEVLPQQLHRLHRRAQAVQLPEAGTDAVGADEAPSERDGLDDDAVHRARKAAKRLRYLLDAFASLEPEQGLRLLRKVLRRVQDELGAFQDHVVTVDAIERLGHEVADLTPTMLMELGRRSEQHRQAADAAAARFVERYAELGEHRRRFARRLAAYGSGHPGAGARRGGAGPDGAAS